MALKDLFIKEDEFIFVVQWHLTDKCDFRCRHCYINRSPKKELSLEQIIPTIDEFSDVIKRLGVKGRFHFTGGNPLLRTDLYDIIKYTISKNIGFGILGNPTATQEELKKLKELGITKYQISLDGFKENHENIRGKDTFEQAINFLRILKQERITPDVMTTVAKRNMKDIPELAKYLYENKLVKRFDFARLVPIGRGKELENSLPSPQEFRQFMYKMLDVYKELKQKNSKYYIGTKDPLWSLLFYEQGETVHNHSKDLICGGCGVGISSLTIDTDGTIQSCRRIDDDIGNITTHSLWNTFINSEKLNKLRDQYAINGCNTCEILSACRGCRAVTKGVTGSCFEKDPQCWKS